MLLAFDTETTGLDLYHSARPFLLTLCNAKGVTYYEWEVDPHTREVHVPLADKAEIVELFDRAKTLVAHNAKFDISALASIGIVFKPEWFEKLHDTLYMGHLLNSNQAHDLTTMALVYLRKDIQPLEDAIDEATTKARDYCRRHLPKWKITRAWDDEQAKDLGLPSAKDKLHKSDMWLPKALAKHLRYSKDHPWFTALENYANADSAITRSLWIALEEICKSRGLWNVYQQRQKLIRVIYEMESNGVTYSDTRLQAMKQTFSEEVDRDTAICLNLSRGKLKSLPASGTTKDMRELLFKEWNLPIVKQSDKTGEPSVDKSVLAYWNDTLPQRSSARAFVRHLQNKRKRDTGISYMQSYERFGVEHADRECRLLHPWLNATGSHTLRMSSSNPNEQNISKQKDSDGTSIRYCFGPARGREWWSLDFSNLELTIPAYEAGEEAMIALFERPDDPPYYGSQHLLVAHTLWPKEFEECLRNGEDFKSKYKSTLYQWTKNGNFAVTYGAMEESGTADDAYHQVGAQAKVKARFKNLEALNQQCIAHANQHGFVWTMLDKEIKGRYPIQVPKSWRGKVKPTQPLNYHVQGTAMWVMCKAMIRVADYLRASIANGYITMQIHDELVIDLPKGKTPLANFQHIQEIKRLMELSGKDIGVPLRVEYSFHPNNWANDEIQLLNQTQAS